MSIEFDTWVSNTDGEPRIVLESVYYDGNQVDGSPALTVEEAKILKRHLKKFIRDHEVDAL